MLIFDIYVCNSLLHAVPSALFTVAGPCFVCCGGPVHPDRWHHKLESLAMKNGTFNLIAQAEKIQSVSQSREPCA